ncbi:MAG: Enzyme that catalyzes the fourth step in the histidine pathway [Watsoniomyces obsoletus]|nr:MAG: Enzyme that catalyzes the fourth step in the histidine pathway [Watsoniomyces obsoletus]
MRLRPPRSRGSARRSLSQQASITITGFEAPSAGVSASNIHGSAEDLVDASPPAGQIHDRLNPSRTPPIDEMKNHTTRPKPPPRPELARLPTAEQIAAVSKSPPLSPTDSETTYPRPRDISHDRVSLQINEQSPLLLPTDSDHGRPSMQYGGPQMDGAEEMETTETKSAWYLILLTIGIGGLQIAWTVELSNGTPYLLSLGLSKSMMALVWIAGPLSGTLVQPYVGIRSDDCRIRWGRRKPFMIGGSIATIISLLALAWTRLIVQSLLSIVGFGPETQMVKISTIVTAVFFVYVLDFAINTVQAAIRAFIVDGAPPHQQDAANAWAGRATGVGNILGYLSGYVKLPQIVPFFGNTQFKGLCVIACIALGTTVAISSLTIPERDPRLEGPPRKSKSGVLAFFRQVFKSIRRLPPQIKAVCQVQFFAWVGWFPFLFYITTYIGQLYANPFFEKNPDMTDAEVDDVWEHATRIGTRALLVFAVTSFIASIVLPFIISPPEASEKSSSGGSSNGLDDDYDSLDLNGKYSTSSLKKYSCNHMLSKVVIPGLTLRRAWLLSHVLFAMTMFSTFFVRTAAAGTALVGILGLSWALTLWAPFALISAEISRRDTLRRARLQHSHNTQQQASTRRRVRPRRVLSNASHVSATDADDLEQAETAEGGGEDRAGIILGLHNVCVSAPQVIATLGSSIIFRALQKPRGTPGDDSVGWVLRLAAVSTLVAAWATLKVREEAPVSKDGVAEEVRRLEGGG